MMITLACDISRAEPLIFRHDKLQIVSCTGANLWSHTRLYERVPDLTLETKGHDPIVT